MPDDNFVENLLRMVAAELHASLAWQVSREMFGKAYSALGVGERATVDQAIVLQVGANYNSITAEYLKGQTAKSQVGFQPPQEGK